MSDAVEKLRLRMVELDLSHSAVDRLVGKSGYTNKVMNRKKGLGPKVTAQLSRALALKSDLVIDAEREALMQAEWEKQRRR